MIPGIGDIVRVRSRQCLVEGVEPAPRPADTTLVRLSCLEDDAQLERLEVLWEREFDARLLRWTNRDRTAIRDFPTLEADGMSPRHQVLVHWFFVEEPAAGQGTAGQTQFVWSPPDLDQVDARKTAVVVQGRFGRATSSVLISTFALFKRKKAEALFGELAERMDREAALVVWVFANIHPKYGEKTPSIARMREFRDRMIQDVWPGTRLPEVFTDPRSHEIDGLKRAVLHAEAVVVEGRWTLLTSPNFTDSAHERNIEAGLVIDDRHFAERVTGQFDEFIPRGILRGLSLPSVPGVP